MGNKKIQEQRERLKSLLLEIVGASQKIEAELANEPSKKGSVYRSIKPKGREWLSCSKDAGFVLGYVDVNGQLYEIQVRKQ